MYAGEVIVAMFVHALAPFGQPGYTGDSVRVESSLGRSSR